MITLSEATRYDLIALLITVDWDFSRIQIAENELETNSLNLYIEDKMDFKKNLADCILIEVPLTEFEQLCNAEDYYVGSDYQRKNIREEILQSILTGLLESNL